MDRMAGELETVPDGTWSEVFGMESGAAGPPPMVDFRGHDGTHFAIPYARLHAVTYDGVREIVLEYDHYRVTIRGRNLTPLYHGFVRNRVDYVREERFDDRTEAEPFVDAIRVRLIPEPAPLEPE